MSAFAKFCSYRGAVGFEFLNTGTRPTTRTFKRDSFETICATNTVTSVSKNLGIYILGIDDVMMSLPPNTSSYYLVLVYVFCICVHLHISRQLCELAYTFIILCGRMIFSNELRII